MRTDQERKRGPPIQNRMSQKGGKRTSEMADPECGAAGDATTARLGFDRAKLIAIPCARKEHPGPRAARTGVGDGFKSYWLGPLSLGRS
jgi:hypothetical protein